MKLFLAVAAVIVSATFTSCASKQSPPGSTDNPIVVTQEDMDKAKAQDDALRRLAAEHQRFLPIAPYNGMVQGVPWHGFFALDTTTGMLCRTVNRIFSGQAEWANDVPLCTDVKNDPLGILGNQKAK